MCLRPGGPRGGPGSLGVAFVGSVRWVEVLELKDLTPPPTNMEPEKSSVTDLCSEDQLPVFCDVLWGSE